ncbi:acyltransferase [Amylibacter sp.]|nr:acyltransferase [Amylibacter sp.]
MHIGSEFFSDDELKSFNFKSVGKNVKIKKNVGIYFVENVTIGNNVRIDDNTVIVASNKPVILGNYVHIASNCYIAASNGLDMEDFSGLAPGVSIFTGSDDYSGSKLTNPTVDQKYIGGKSGKVTLGRHVIIGAHSVILPRVQVGEGSSVGALSLVTKSLDPWGIFFGSPVKRLKARSKKLLKLEKDFLEEQD